MMVAFRRRWRRETRSRRSAVLQFAISGIVATVAIGALTVTVTRDIGTKQAIRDAKLSTRLAGEGLVAHHITDAVMAGDPAALQRLDHVVHRSVLRDGIVRAKIWTPDARVLYSDEARLIGEHFTLEPNERAALRGGMVVAQVSSLEGPENRFEKHVGKLLEVYVPIHARSGQRLTFEAYHRFKSVASSGRRLWLAFAPALLGGLLLLLLITLPLAWSLARRVRAGQQQRETLLLQALNASQVERRGIAADLHDGVVQELTGAAFSLSARAREQAIRGHADASQALRESAGVVRDSVGVLRTLLIDIYPPNLHRSGLGTALGDLATLYTGRGVATSVEAPDGLAIDAATERLLFRCAQEMLRNTHRHASATTAEIRVEQTGHELVMDVIDNGVGFDPALLDSGTQDGHFGLSVLRDLILAAGGRLSIRPTAPTGTHVQIQLPTRPPAPARPEQRWEGRETHDVDV